MKEMVKESRLFKSSPNHCGIDRRQFLRRMGILGGGILISFSLGDTKAFARMKREGFLGANIPNDFNAFLRIGMNERITLLTGKIEMGQGPIVSLPQMLADELDVSYEAVDIVMGDTDLCPWDAGTFGSFTTRYFGIFLREAACEAKGVLKELAAERLKCPLNQLITKDGIIFDKNNPLSKISYGHLTEGKIIERHLKELPDLKKLSELTVMGKSFRRSDGIEKVTGKATYAGDIRLEEMLYAKILRPPTHDAILKKVDITKAKAVKGIEIVRDKSMIAVLHRLPDEAERGLKLIAAEYDSPKTELNNRTIFDHLLKHSPKPVVAAKKGIISNGNSISNQKLSENYYDSYVAHAPIEPHTAIAHYTEDRITVWASTQAPYPMQQEVSEALMMPIDKVRIITPFVGGGFGGKVKGPQVIEAAYLSKQVKKPVQVAWTREEECFYDTFHPAAIVKIHSGWDAKGNITLWDYHVHFAGERGCECYYEIPHQKVSVYGSWQQQDRFPHPFFVGPWRGPGNNTNVFARETHMNFMASQMNTDPLELRLKHLKDPRMISVLKAAADKFGWKPIKTPSGKGFGIACGIDAETYVAAMAEVVVDKKNGEIRVERIVCAQDMGFIVNPEGAKMQMEGCITMGLGYALTEEILFEDGKILNSNFNRYILPRFSWLPKIETILVENKEHPPEGGGEPAIILMGALMATAVFDATGVKLTQMPFSRERVKAALSEKT